MTRSYSSGGLRARMSKMSGRAWFPISSASPKPRVVTSAKRAPSRSSSPFVATVVPIRIHSIRDASSGASRGCATPVASSSTRRIPSRGAFG